MSHDYTCRFCNEIKAELFSWHYLTPNRRRGYDYYECKGCGKHYVIACDDANMFPIPTSETREQFFARVLVECANDFGRAIQESKSEIKR